jgi:hypothetical protein
MDCERLPSSSLPIREDSSIIPVDARNRDLFPAHLKDLLLRYRVICHMVINKRPWLSAVNRDRAIINISGHSDLRTALPFLSIV